MQQERRVVVIGWAWHALNSQLGLSKQRMAMKRRCLPQTFLSVILFSSLIVAVPQYVTCEDLYPDELLDLFGMPTNSVTNAIFRTHYPPVLVSSDFNVGFPARHQPEDPYLQLYTAEPVLLVILRC